MIEKVKALDRTYGCRRKMEALVGFGSLDEIAEYVRNHGGRVAGFTKIPSYEEWFQVRYYGVADFGRELYPGMMVVTQDNRDELFRSLVSDLLCHSDGIYDRFESLSRNMDELRGRVVDYLREGEDMVFYDGIYCGNIRYGQHHYELPGGFRQFEIGAVVWEEDKK